MSKRQLWLSVAPTIFCLVYPLLAFGVLGGNWGLAVLESLYPFVGASLIWTAMTQTSHVQDDCHQPLNVRRSRSACGLTVVTKCADVVVTLKRQSWLNDAGYLCGNQPVRRVHPIIFY